MSITFFQSARTNYFPDGCLRMRPWFPVIGGSSGAGCLVGFSFIWIASERAGQCVSRVESQGRVAACPQTMARNAERADSFAFRRRWRRRTPSMLPRRRQSTDMRLDGGSCHEATIWMHP